MSACGLCTYTQAPTEASGVRSPEVEVGMVEASDAVQGSEPRSSRRGASGLNAKSSCCPQANLRLITNVIQISNSILNCFVL